MRVTDAGFAQLAHLRNLEYLNLATGDNSFPPLATDSRLKCIAGMGHLPTSGSLAPASRTRGLPASEGEG